MELDHLILWVRHLIAASQAMELTAPILDVEIREAVFGVGNEKSPGPDGYTAKFYKAA
ncbi:UNVERIFIED_CONTAM: hypothetical protein Sradi_3961600 [Sesamum radiatum]|uniref:Uncharacterized protein n=1 Tax=Sesamum radiatum TaxID=300843 RepID=A0AAW2PGY5_SESRA